ncbi:helix-turn-helix domain-containing protein [Microbacterium sp. No. 7]|uniref:helix-turn-helix domain-containing protein n=1 Tax=Microbacterium sp. No. 7 TaxID=1714373 RepID=UPI0006D17CEE|nr:helix-turn-helix domain-containing protein [Microbacterium sp. No. 7]ALJ19452.1 transcriptional regulator [Microbacterium sp. No. 7]
MADDGLARPVPALTARQPRAIHSALTVLEAVAELGAGVTARELSAALQLPRATTYRLLNLLVEDEYLVRTPDLSGFALGAKVAQLAAAVAPQRMPTAARRLIADARAAVRGGVHVAGFAGGRVHVLDEDPDFPLSDPVRLSREPEQYAVGRLLLVAAGDDGPAARAAARELETVGAIRRVDDRSGCLAMPVRDHGGSIAGAIVFAGPRHRVTEPGVLLAQLRPVAEQIAPYIT